MAIIDTASLSSPAHGRDGQSHSFAGLPFARLPFARLPAFFNSFLARALDPYRPELHYMRGPGPACRAKLASTLRHAS